MRTTLAMAALGCIAASASLHAGEGGASYGQQLAQVYGTYQSILANKEACNDASPATRGAIERAYTGWRSRNAQTITELDDRLTRMIRGASRDEKEYARNIGKYEGAMLQQRTEAKRAMLGQPREELEALCKALPELLAGRENDLDVLYADELKSLRARH